jgi:hypothetical protein
MTNGIVAFLASGYNSVSISGQTVSIAGSIAATAGVSGQTVYLANDGINNVALTSGQSIRITDTTANVVQISSVGGLGQTVGRLALDVNSIDLGYHRTNNRFFSLELATPISGEGYRLLVATSGQAELISGQTIRIGHPGNTQIAAIDTSNHDALASGNAALVTHSILRGFHPTNIQFARIYATSMQSGDGYRLMVATSGQVNYEMGANVRSAAGTVITAASGGTQLANVSGFSFLLRSHSGNSTMMVSSTNDPPNVIGISGIGVPIYGGDSLTLKVNNLNTIRVLAGVSGQVLAFMAVDR